METIKVNLAEHGYPIWIDRQLLDRLPDLLADNWQSKQVVVITQALLAEQYGQKLTGALSKSGFNAALLLLPAGEEAKALVQVEDLYRQLLDLNCDKDTLLLALGGGTVGDVTGFVAATFLRGIAYLQVPTTLLAMVDSAIGGKTGVNLPQGKNLVGAIHQPAAVAIDPEFLKSLPGREIVSGLAEVLKYGAIQDREFWQELTENLEALMIVETTAILRAIRKSCAIKAGIVVRDEHEQDLRRILNLGHTIGHALENLSGYGQLTHGEAVALGMLCAGEISYQRGFINDDDWRSLSTTLRRLPLPALPNITGAKVLEVIRRDKKVRSGRLHFVLLEGLGKAVIIDDVTDEEIMQSLEVL
ncbi:MAG: 3-dehydroquinate synthase [Candidatus Marinimicrobia bacterium]|nr:3-dehydroquinate synthase [Candidatus Neomarinimicrobiota bacterium]